jgi:hypothetical protein
MEEGEEVMRVMKMFIVMADCCSLQCCRVWLPKEG